MYLQAQKLTLMEGLEKFVRVYYLNFQANFEIILAFPIDDGARSSLLDVAVGSGAIGLEGRITIARVVVATSYDALCARHV